MKLEEKKTYYLKHMEIVPTRMNQANYIVETAQRNRDGDYEYIGRHGNKLHFYDWKQGFDLFITKAEFEDKHSPNGA